jgi:hypothetical protein
VKVVQVETRIPKGGPARRLLQQDHVDIVTPPAELEILLSEPAAGGNPRGDILGEVRIEKTPKRGRVRLVAPQTCPFLHRQVDRTGLLHLLLELAVTGIAEPASTPEGQAELRPCSVGMSRGAPLVTGPAPPLSEGRVGEGSLIETAVTGPFTAAGAVLRPSTGKSRQDQGQNSRQNCRNPLHGCIRQRREMPVKSLCRSFVYTYSPRITAFSPDPVSKGRK